MIDETATTNPSRLMPLDSAAELVAKMTQAQMVLRPDR